jgi:hypothetical protein
MAKVREIREVYLSGHDAAFSNFDGVILVNKNIMKLLNSNERTFILLHEAGHIELLTKDENRADAYAFLEYVKLGLPVEHILTAMKRVLTNKPQSRERIDYMQKRIDQYNAAKINAFDGTTGDWLTVIGQLFGLGAQVAGGTSTAEEIEKQEAARVQEEATRKKTISYLLMGGAVIALIVVSIIIFKK